VAAAPPKRSPVADTAAEHRIAKIFGAMQAKDAARVLAQMSDADVRVILAALAPRQQAAILGLFPVERAAEIAKASLRDAGAGQ